MQEEETILEHREKAEKPPYRSATEAFEEWWRHSVARRGQSELTRRQVAEMAYGAGSVLGAKYPSLAEPTETELTPDLLAELEALKAALDQEV